MWESYGRDCIDEVFQGTNIVRHLLSTGSHRRILPSHRLERVLRRIWQY